MIETKNVLYTRKIQFLCLLITGFMELLMIINGIESSYQEFVQYYLVVPSIVFFGIALVTDQWQRARRPLILGSVMVLWFLIAQGLQHLSGEYPFHSGSFLECVPDGTPLCGCATGREGAKGIGLVRCLYDLRFGHPISIQCDAVDGHPAAVYGGTGLLGRSTALC